MFSLAVMDVQWPCNVKSRKIWAMHEDHLGFMYSVYHLHPQFEFLKIFPEISIEHTQMIIKAWQTRIHHHFSLKHHTHHESSTNKFYHQTSKQHNFRNNQPFSKTKASWSSAWIDLSKACIYFKKQGGRNFTKMEEQSRYRCCLVALTQNRCALSF